MTADRPPLPAEITAAIDAYHHAIRDFAGRHEDAARARLEALIAGLVVPDGWKLVPIEPTEAMFQAALDQWNRAVPELDEDDTRYDYLRTWQDMLAAAPLPPPLPKTGA